MDFLVPLKGWLSFELHSIRRTEYKVLPVLILLSTDYEASNDEWGNPCLGCDCVCKP